MPSSSKSKPSPRDRANAPASRKRKFSSSDASISAHNVIYRQKRSYNARGASEKMRQLDVPPQAKVFGISDENESAHAKAFLLENSISNREGNRIGHLHEEEFIEKKDTFSMHKGTYSNMPTTKRISKTRPRVVSRTNSSSHMNLMPKTARRNLTLLQRSRTSTNVLLHATGSSRSSKVSAAPTPAMSSILNSVQMITTKFSQEFYQNGNALYAKRQYKAAFTCYKKCLMRTPDHAKAHFKCALIYSKQSTVGAQRMMMRHYEASARSHYPNACYNLALIYRHGYYEQKPNAELAVKYFESASQSGHASASLNLGILYHAGLCGVLQNHKAAYKYYTLAQRQGDGITRARAEYNIGFYHEHGLGGIQQCNDTAFKHYLQAAIKKIPQGECAVGFFLEKGKGPNRQRDVSEAINWYVKAAENGNIIAQLRLGVLFHEGIDVERDTNRAYNFFSKATNNNFEGAIDELKSFSVEMSQYTRLNMHSRYDPEKITDIMKLVQDMILQKEKEAEVERRQEEEERKRSSQLRTNIVEVSEDIFDFSDETFDDVQDEEIENLIREAESQEDQILRVDETEIEEPLQIVENDVLEATKELVVEDAPQVDPSISEEIQDHTMEGPTRVEEDSLRPDNETLVEAAITSEQGINMKYGPLPEQNKSLVAEELSNRKDAPTDVKTSRENVKEICPSDFEQTNGLQQHQSSSIEVEKNDQPIHVVSNTHTNVDQLEILNVVQLEQDTQEIDGDNSQSTPINSQDKEESLDEREEGYQCTYKLDVLPHPEPVEEESSDEHQETDASPRENDAENKSQIYFEETINACGTKISIHEEHGAIAEAPDSANDLPEDSCMLTNEESGFPEKEERLPPLKREEEVVIDSKDPQTFRESSEETIENMAEGNVLIHAKQIDEEHRGAELKGPGPPSCDDSQHFDSVEFALENDMPNDEVIPEKSVLDTFPHAETAQLPVASTVAERTDTSKDFQDREQQVELTITGNQAAEESEQFGTISPESHKLFSPSGAEVDVSTDIFMFGNQSMSGTSSIEPVPKMEMTHSFDSANAERVSDLFNNAHFNQQIVPNRILEANDRSQDEYVVALSEDQTPISQEPESGDILKATVSSHTTEVDTQQSNQQERTPARQGAFMKEPVLLEMIMHQETDEQNTSSEHQSKGEGHSQTTEPALPVRMSGEIEESHASKKSIKMEELCAHSDPQPDEIQRRSKTVDEEQILVQNNKGQLNMAEKHILEPNPPMPSHMESSVVPKETNDGIQENDIVSVSTETLEIEGHFETPRITSPTDPEKPAQHPQSNEALTVSIDGSESPLPQNIEQRNPTDTASLRNPAQSWQKTWDHLEDHKEGVTFLLIDGHRRVPVFYRYKQTPNAKAALILMHDLGDSSALMAPVAIEASKASIDVFSFDMIGHGRSHLASTMLIEDYQKFIVTTTSFLHFIVEKFSLQSHRIFIMAQGLGAAIALHSVTSRELALPISGMLLVNTCHESAMSSTLISHGFWGIVSSIVPKAQLIKFDCCAESSTNGKAFVEFRKSLGFDVWLEPCIPAQTSQQITSLYRNLYNVVPYIKCPLMWFVSAKDNRCSSPQISMKLLGTCTSRDVAFKTFKDGSHYVVFDEREGRILLEEALNWIRERIT
uniref:Serine aminopeptidase S33 domain-containing protein n=1 Tax=Percolomonas cosmopolitus TaxID=63605 RepID=A0A7S1KM70_9EUKA